MSIISDLCQRSWLSFLCHFYIVNEFGVSMAKTKRVVGLCVKQTTRMIAQLNTQFP